MNKPDKNFWKFVDSYMASVFDERKLQRCKTMKCRLLRPYAEQPSKEGK